MREILLLFALLFSAGCTAPRIQTTDTDAGAPTVVVDPAWRENRTRFREQTVYFELSTANLNAEARPKLAEVADYMKANPVVALRIEGHGDGSGTDEQNLELGDRRAEALRKELTRLGVDPERVETWGCGKRPQTDRGYAPGTPRKWRRAEFVLLTPPQ